MSRPSDRDDSIPASSYEPLLPPGEFKSQIPPHLTQDASPQDQHIMDALSIGSQYHKWLVDALVATHSQVRRTNGRLLQAEADIADLKDDKKSFVRGWRALLAIAGFIAGIVSFASLVYQTFFSSGSGH